MALSLNTSHALAPKVTALIAVDPTSNTLVDLKRSSVSFTLDSGVSVVNNPTYGAAVRTTGDTGSTYAGFSFTPISLNSAAAGFKNTIFLVMAKLAAVANDVSSSRNLSLIGQNAYIYGAIPVITSNANGNKIALDNTSPSSYDAAKTTNIAIKGDGLRHTIATTTANVTGGNATTGKLYVDGVNTGITYSSGPGGDMTISAVNNLNFSSVAYDFMYMVVFNDVLTDAEIANLNASVGDYNVFGLVNGAGAVAAAPAGTVTVSSVTPSTTSAVVNYTYSAADQTGYEYRLNGGAATTLGASPATISGLTASTSYTLEVRAINATGSGAWSTPVTNFTTSAVADSTAPTLTGSITSSSVTSGGYTASWPIASDNVAVTGYEYSINSGAWTSTGTSTSVSVTGRTAGTTDTFQVRAYDAAGNRSTALSANITLAASADSTNPVLSGSITVSALGSTSYTIAWPTGSDNVAVTGYEYNLNSTGWISVGNSTSANISGRTPGTTDNIQVRAYDAAGNRSTPALSATANLTAVVTGSIVVSDPLKNNAGNLLTSLSGIKATVLRSSDFVSVCTVTGLTTDGSGVLSTVANASISAGTAYHVVIKTSSGGVGVTGPINAS